MNDPITLPGLPFWQARSFWFSLATVSFILSDAAGLDLGRLLGVTTPEAAADSMIATIQSLAPIVTGALAFRERVAPKMRLTL